MEKEKVKVADLVRNAKAKFSYVQSGVLFYEIENDTHVTMLPIDLYNEEIKKDPEFDWVWSGIEFNFFDTKSK